jgi:hypothetical protein
MDDELDEKGITIREELLGPGTGRPRWRASLISPGSSRNS